MRCDLTAENNNSAL